MLRYLLHHLMFGFTLFAAEAPPLGGTSGTDGGGTGGGAAPSGTPAPDGGAGQGSPAPGVQPAGSEGLRQLRESYENLKKDFEPWQKLGVKPDQVGQFQGVYTKLHSEIAAIGRELGYPDSDIAEAMAEDPVRTLDFLRNEAARIQQGGGQRQGGEDLNDLVQQHIEQALGPIQQRENTRMTNEANSLFERTVHQLAVESFKAEGIDDVAKIPADEMFMLTSAVSEILKYDGAALEALKYEGKTAPIQQAFQEARTMLDKYYLARAGRDKARVQPVRPGQAPPPADGKRPSLDDIINDPGVINAKYR